MAFDDIVGPGKFILLYVKDIEYLDNVPEIHLCMAVGISETENHIILNDGSVIDKGCVQKIFPDRVLNTYVEITKYYNEKNSLTNISE